MELNKIYNEDCLTTMSNIQDNYVDLTVTSPPYEKLRKYNGFSFDFEKTAQQLFRITSVGGVVVWIVNDMTINGSETGSSFKQALYFMSLGFNLYDTMIYKKLGTVVQNPVIRYSQDFEYIFVLSKETPKSLNIRRGEATGKIINKTKRHRHLENIMVRGRYRQGTAPFSNVFEYAVGANSTNDLIAFKHPAIFPDKLAADMIYSFSNAGDIVYDPFTGSGTVFKQSFLQKRNFIGSEISSEYVDIANKRMQPYLNQTTLL